MGGITNAPFRFSSIVGRLLADRRLLQSSGGLDVKGAAPVELIALGYAADNGEPTSFPHGCVAQFWVLVQCDRRVAQCQFFEARVGGGARRLAQGSVEQGADGAGLQQPYLDDSRSRMV